MDGWEKNVCGLHDTLKSVLSKEWFNELSWFLHADGISGKWPFCQGGLKYTVSRMKWWVELIFCIVVEIQEG